MLSEQGSECRALIHHLFWCLYLKSLFPECYICIFIQEGGGGEISLPEAHHAASRVMQAITSRERSSGNSQFFSYFCVINHLKLSFFFFLPHKEFTTFNTSDNLLCPRIYMRLYGVHPSCHRTGINSQLQPKLDKWKEMDGQKDFKDLWLKYKFLICLFVWIFVTLPCFSSSN